MRARDGGYEPVVASPPNAAGQDPANVELIRVANQPAQDFPALPGANAQAVQNFRELGPDWCEEQVPGSRALLEKYALDLPERVEQHDMSEAVRLLDWTPRIGFLEFLRDLQERDARGEDVRALWAPGQIPNL